LRNDKNDYVRGQVETRRDNANQGRVEHIAMAFDLLIPATRSSVSLSPLFAARLELMHCLVNEFVASSQSY
jgi:hypothetical protein